MKSSQTIPRSVTVTSLPTLLTQPKDVREAPSVAVVAEIKLATGVESVGEAFTFELTAVAQSVETRMSSTSTVEAVIAPHLDVIEFLQFQHPIIQL